MIGCETGAALGSVGAAISERSVVAEQRQSWSAAAETVALRSLHGRRCCCQLYRLRGRSFGAGTTVGFAIAGVGAERIRVNSPLRRSTSARIRSTSGSTLGSSWRTTVTGSGEGPTKCATASRNWFSRDVVRSRTSTLPVRRT